MSNPLLFWVVFNAAILGMLWFDLKVFHKNAHEVVPKEAFAWSLFWVGISLSFAFGLYFLNPNKCLEFITGYVVEKSLSIDNIFVFSIIFRSFGIPLKHQHRVLFWGILGALLLRGLMIWSGLALISLFHWLLYVLGAFLLFTGLKVFWLSDKPHNFEQHPILLFLQRYFPISPKIEGQRLWVRSYENPRRWQMTPLFAALVMIEFSDVVFAIDSIPAILSITLDPFIAYTSNVFAILGLRSLYFLLADAIERFYYLKSAVALILCFVGMKMLIMDWYKIPTVWSLVVILLILCGGILLSNFCRSQECRK